ncbi:MAG: hypothetical protein V4532_04090 [Pseudomonadota bacterium]
MAKRKGLAMGVVASLVTVAWMAGCAFLNSGDQPNSHAAAVAPVAVAPNVTKPDATLASRTGAKLPPPANPRNWVDARLQAAHRLVAANPEITYLSRPPDILRAIPVLTVELNGNGSVKNIEVMRYPSQDRETVGIAMNAIRRAAPFGDVSKLPKPWRFNETFLFNNQHKFKPMTLDRL